MTTKNHFTAEQAEEMAKQLGINWDEVKYDTEQLRRGMDVELEHGLENAVTNVTNDDSLMTAKIALAHLNEYPDYYIRLDEMEEAAEAFWEGKDKGKEIK